MKLCIDCKYFLPSVAIRDQAIYDRCKHAGLENKTVELVRGVPIHAFYDFCINMRSQTGKCGPNAELFEPILSPSAEVELARDKKIEERAEIRGDRIDANRECWEDFDFDRDSGARP